MQKKEYHLILSGPRVKYLKPVNQRTAFMPVEFIDDYKIPNVYRTTNKDGQSVTYRLIAETDEIDQKEQIKLGFLANYKFTARDRELAKFVRGIIETDKVNQQAFFDAVPGNEKFEGDRGEYPVLFREHVPKVAQKANLDLGLRQAKAIVSLHTMEEETMATVLLRIYGGNYELPENKADKMEALQNAINEVTDDLSTPLDIILGVNDVETVETIVGKAINQKVLSFIEKPNQVVIKRNGVWQDFAGVSEDLQEEQKLAVLLDRLQSSSGETMLISIKEAIRNNGGQKNISSIEKVIELPKPTFADLSDIEFEAEMQRRKGLKDVEEKNKKEAEAKIKEAAAAKLKEPEKAK